MTTTTTATIGATAAGLTAATATTNTTTTTNNDSNNNNIKVNNDYILNAGCASKPTHLILKNGELCYPKFNPQTEVC